MRIRNGKQIYEDVNIDGGDAVLDSLGLPDVADTTLSGAPKVFTLHDDSGTPYYFKAYPTKA